MTNLKLTETQKNALRFFHECPNESGEGVIASTTLAFLKKNGLIVAHPDTTKGTTLLDTSFTLTERGEMLCPKL